MAANPSKLAFASTAAETRARAAVIASPTHTRVEEVIVRAPKPNEVRVRLEGCGVCASNLPVWEGREWFSYPFAAGAPGHEGWGVVDAIGEGVHNVEPGDRVAFLSGHAYAQFDIAPAASVLKLPQELANAPFPGEPLGCVMNFVERSDLHSGQSVAVIGTGFLGLLVTQLAARTGAHVSAFSRREYALNLARQMGAAEAFSSAEDAVKNGYAVTEGRGFDRVIEVVGEQSTLTLASDLVAEGGRLVIAGYHQDGLRQVNMQQWNWRGIDVINAHERNEQRYISGMQRALAAVLDGRLDPFPLFTHRVPLARLDDAFELMKARPDGFVKALVMFDASVT